MTHPEWLELYNERAAILEYLGGYPREEAERRALDEVGMAPTDETKGSK